MDITVVAPCKGCIDRKVGCHGKCEKYTAWSNSRQKVIKAEHDERARHNWMWKSENHI